MSGTSTIPVSAGGTGASSASGALAALGGVSMSTTAAQTLAGPLNASVNSQLNVMAYGAKGDCTTDDHNAIVAAMTASQALKVGNASPAVVYFPKPPGGCYKTSTIEYTGVPFVGQPSGDGTSTASYGVVIKGMPGYDILHVYDPSLGTATWNPSWYIRDISFVVDNSILPTTTTVPNLLHRWPGRWVDDGAMTSGSAIFTGPRGDIGCADVGEPIQVNGAGVAGANLVTTIASVDPCWSVGNGGAAAWKTVTLAAAASTTVSAAHYYVSVLDLPVTTNIGNCSIAFDNLDSNTANWPALGQVYGSNHAKLLNVNFNATSGAAAANNHCGIFAQGQWNSFNSFHADHVNFYALDFGVVEAPSEINPLYSTGGDFQHWDHMQFFVERYPWISYNGGESEMDHVQFTTLSGPQFMQAANNYADVPGWKINIQEMETWSMPGDSRYGLRTEGSGFNITGELSISADPVNQAWIDSLFTTCTNCFTSPGQINLFGIGNTITGDANGTPINNKGKGNSATAYNNGAGYPSGIPAPTANTLLPQKGVPNLSGGSEPDFVADGYPATPYRHEDLFLWPQDFILGTAGMDQWKNLYQDDAASISGGEIFLRTGGNYTQWWPFYYTGNPSHRGNLTIGTNFPAAKGTLYLSLKCATATGTTMALTTSGGGNASQALSCSNSALQTYAIPFDFTSATGNVGIKNNGSAGQDVWVAWAYIDIAPQLPVGTTVGGASLVGGPSSGTAANDMVCYANATGLQQDCNSSAGPSVVTSGSNALTLKSTGSSASLRLEGASTSTNTFYQWWAGGARYWQAGMTVGGPTWLLNDTTNGRNVISLPNNTMPANSIGGNANGATAITQTASDNSTNIATDAFVKANLPPAGTTGSLGGSALAAGACTSGTVNITGATTNMAVVATPVTYPGDGMAWRPYVSSAGVVTVKVCATVAGTPTASTYIVRVIP